MASPSARKGLLLGSTNDIRLAPPACPTAPERPRTDISPAQRGPWSPGWRVPHKVAILPREVAVAAPNCQNGLPAPLARDRGAPRTQHGHPDSRVALVTRLDQVSLRCWLDTPSPRRSDAPHAHDARATTHAACAYKVLLLTYMFDFSPNIECCLCLVGRCNKCSHSR